MIKTHLVSKLSGESYQNWLAQTAFRGLESGVLYVRVPNEATRVWMEEEYASLVGSAISSLSLPVRRTVYELGAVDEGAVSSAPRATERPDRDPFSQPAHSFLNPKFT
ncbi:MAG: chromosomal replication initiator protein DnaA, partial [Acidobacteriales bacterium]